MGAWGCDAFANDAAADWLADLPAGEVSAEIEEALHAALPSPLALMHKLSGRQVTEYLDADVACIALAAAELVAAMRGRAHPDMNPALRARLEAKTSESSAALAELARLAVQRVGENSELRDLWEESEEFESWTAELEQLAARLNV